jgi:hypothetical protein
MATLVVDQVDGRYSLLRWWAPPLHWHRCDIFWGSNPREKREAKTLSDEPMIPRSERWCKQRMKWNTVWRLKSIGTVGWADGPYSSCPGWMSEIKKWRQRHRMNRWSIGRHRRSIWWSTDARQRCSESEALSIGWTDGLDSSSSDVYEIRYREVLAGRSLTSDEPS